MLRRRAEQRDGGGGGGDGRVGAADLESGPQDGPWADGA